MNTEDSITRQLAGKDVIASIYFYGIIMAAMIVAFWNGYIDKNALSFGIVSSLIVYLIVMARVIQAKLQVVRDESYTTGLDSF